MSNFNLRPNMRERLETSPISDFLKAEVRNSAAAQTALAGSGLGIVLSCQGNGSTIQSDADCSKCHTSSLNTTPSPAPICITDLLPHLHTFCQGLKIYSTKPLQNIGYARLYRWGRVVEVTTGFRRSAPLDERAKARPCLIAISEQ